MRTLFEKSDPHSRRRPFHAVREMSTATALGEAMELMADRKELAQMSVATWRDALKPALERGDFCFLSRKGRIVAFAAWAWTTPAQAKRWHREGELPDTEVGGDTMAVLSLHADCREAAWALRDMAASLATTPFDAYVPARPKANNAMSAHHRISIRTAHGHLLAA